MIFDNGNFAGSSGGCGDSAGDGCCDDLGPMARRFCDLLALVTTQQQQLQLQLQQQGSNANVKQENRRNSVTSNVSATGSTVSKSGRTGAGMDCRSAYAFLHDVLQRRQMTVEEAVARLMDSSRVVDGKLHVDTDLVRGLLIEAGFEDELGQLYGNTQQQQQRQRPIGGGGVEVGGQTCCGPTGPQCV